MTVSMALVDFIPVLLFLIAAIVIQRGLYDIMSKGAFALLCGGTIMVVAAGTMKALWKLLYAAGVCNFERLNQSFFPMQSIGFLLAGIAVAAMLFFPQRKKEETALAAAAPAVFSGTMIFVALLILGSLGYCGGLAVYAARKQKKTVSVLFWITFVCLLGMGYLSSRDFTKPAMNWIAEGVNIAGMLSLLAASIGLFARKKG